MKSRREGKSDGTHVDEEELSARLLHHVFFPLVLGHDGARLVCAIEGRMLGRRAHGDRRDCARWDEDVHDANRVPSDLMAYFCSRSPSPH